MEKKVFTVYNYMVKNITPVIANITPVIARASEAIYFLVILNALLVILRFPLVILNAVKNLTRTCVSNKLRDPSPDLIGIRMTQAGFIKLTKKALISYLITSTAIVGSGLEAAWPACHRYAQALAGMFNDNWRLV